jgi:DNA-binding IclR family transcriptional regulator
MPNHDGAANAAKQRYEIAVVARALDIVSDLARGKTHTTASVAKLTGISSASAYRLLVTLESRGFVAHDPGARSWRLGHAFFTASSSSIREQLRAAALPRLTRLRDEQLETVNLALYAHGEIVYLDVLESPLRFRMSGAPGERAPIHATALGRAVLATLPEELREPIVGHLVYEQLTDRTIAGIEPLRAEIEATATRGWGVEHGETEIGVSCFGAAVRGPDDSPVGAISISVPDARLTPDRERLLGEAVAEAAADIAAAMSRGSLIEEKAN